MGWRQNGRPGSPISCCGSPSLLTSRGGTSRPGWPRPPRRGRRRCPRRPRIRRGSGGRGRARGHATPRHRGPRCEGDTGRRGTDSRSDTRTSGARRARRRGRRCWRDVRRAEQQAQHLLLGLREERFAQAGRVGNSTHNGAYNTQNGCVNGLVRGARHPGVKRRDGLPSRGALVIGPHGGRRPR